MTDLMDLHAPLPPGDIGWRLTRSGESNSQLWAYCVPYLTAGAVMNRLDAVCGPTDWQSDFRDSGVRLQCGIGIRVGDEWIWKWDGTGSLAASGGLSASDAGKGDHSNGLKRAGYQFGIGRYLATVPELKAIINSNGRYYGKTKTDVSFRWDHPALPSSALPLEVPPIVVDMRELLARGAGLGLGGDDDAKVAAGIQAIERGIEAHDTKSLLRARPWLEGEVDKLESGGDQGAAA